MSRLTRLYASNFLKCSVISAVSDDLSHLGEPLGPDKLVSDENLEIGNNTWVAVAELATRT